MSTESQIAALVQAANNLTGAVTGKISDIDKAVESAGKVFDAQMLEMKNRLPRMAVTRNFRMMDTNADGIPDDWGFHSEVTPALIREVSGASEAAGRPADVVTLLNEIQADVREVYPNFNIRSSDYYRSSFSIWKFQWSKRAIPVSGAYLAYPMAVDQSVSASPSVPTNSYATIGAFVRVVDGSIVGGWSWGAQKGKWRWCSAVIAPQSAFGAYNISHPMRDSDAGVVQVAFAAVCTGVISDPNDWGAMLSIGG